MPTWHSVPDSGISYCRLSPGEVGQESPLRFPKMGNASLGFKERLMQRLRPLPTLFVFRTFMPHRRSKDFRVVVLGPAGVGKSALVQRWVRGTFRDNYLPTIEDTYRQVQGCNHARDALHITDTTGGHRYPDLQRLAISRGHAFVLVYSVTKKETLEQLKPFYELIREIKGSNLHKFPIVLVGNKRDDRFHRELTLRDGAARALEWNCAFLETSAKVDVNVEELFHVLLNQEKPDTCPQGPQNKSQKPKDTKKLLGNCVIM